MLLNGKKCGRNKEGKVSVVDLSILKRKRQERERER